MEISFEYKQNGPAKEASGFEGKPVDIEYLPVFVARQAVFDIHGAIWGYELLYRTGETKGYTGENGSKATAQVITDGIALAMNAIPQSCPVLINFPKDLLLGEAANALPTENCIPEILEDVEATPEVLSAVRQLKDEGYTIALDDYTGQEELEPYLELVDILKIDMLDMEFPDIIKLTQALKKYDCKLLAEKIEDSDTYDLAKALGYSYFQGFYFSKPEIVEGRKLKRNALTQFKLLQELADPEYRVAQVAQTISLDIGLSHRLLRYMAVVTRDQTITSLPHAVTILGARPLKQWLMIVMIADMTEGDRAGELIYQAARRGKFMELISWRIRIKGVNGDGLFLLGLFSNLDALLNQPMVEVVEHLPIGKDMSEALCGISSPLQQLVALLEDLDSGEWAQVESRLEELSIPREKAAKAFAEAGTWAHEILSDTEGVAV